jgi:flavin-dependent dehydrogenase
MVNSAQTDAFVVGGGPAGLAAAIALRAKGFRVVVADPARPPIDKACGEGLMPESIAALRELGVSIGPGRGFLFRGVRFLSGCLSIDASFPNGPGLGIRRTVLHQMLVDRAMAVGVTPLWGTRVTGIGSDHVVLGDQEFACRWIIGADGQNSRVRNWAGLDRMRHDSRRFGFRRHYRLDPWTDSMEVYWGNDCQVYVTPVGSEEICLALLSRDSHLRLDQALQQFPELSRRLQQAVLVNSERGAISAFRRLKTVASERVSLIGDASGSVDAITGSGLYLSFRQALALADAITRGRLDLYQAAHNRLLRRPALMSTLILTLDRFPWLRERTLRAFASKPVVFENLLAIHVGELPSLYPTL